MHLGCTWMRRRTSTLSAPTFTASISTGTAAIPLRPQISALLPGGGAATAPALITGSTTSIISTRTGSTRFFRASPLRCSRTTPLSTSWWSRYAGRAERWWGPFLFSAGCRRLARRCAATMFRSTGNSASRILLPSITTLSCAATASCTTLFAVIRPTTKPPTR
jgi:hypothetical protein